MSLYEFKSSLYSPCNQSTQRRRKVCRCWVSSSPIKREKYENMQIRCQPSRLSSLSGEKQIHFQCKKISNAFISPQMSNFHTRLVCRTVQREQRAGWLPPRPSVVSSWSFFVFVFGGSGLTRCQSIYLFSQTTRAKTKRA